MTAYDDIFAEDGPLSKLLPAYRRRQEQVDLTNEVGELLEGSGAVGLFEAGTGTGKTLSYLIPALRVAARDRKIIISTHTIALQQQLSEKDIPIALQIVGGNNKVLTAKGRGNYLCLLALDSQAHGVAASRDEPLAGVRKWAIQTGTGDRSDLPFVYDRWPSVAANADTCLGRSCGFYDRCFYFNMRRKLENASVILVNHALFFSDLALKSDPSRDGDAGLLPEYDAVIFDEAHNIPKVAADAFTRAVSIGGLYDLLRKVNGAAGFTRVDKSTSAQNAAEEFFGVFRGAPEREFLISREAEGPYETVENSGLKLISELAELEKQLTPKTDPPASSEDEWLAALARSVRAYREDAVDVLLAADDNRVLWGERADARTSSSAVTLFRTPVKLGELMRQTLWNKATPNKAALFSATLTTEADFSYIKGILGLNRSERPLIEAATDSPFDYRTQCLVYMPESLSPPENTVDYRHQLVDEIAALLQASRGGAFVLLTSHRALMDVYVQLLALELPYPLLKQGDAPPGRLIERFKSKENSVLLGTFSFWEGIDVQGSSLRLVVIDRLPFSVPNHPVARAQAERCYAEGEDWFNETVVPQAVIRLKQGIGRLIRSESDYGVIALLDSRLGQSRYGEAFLASLPDAPRTSDIARVERLFDRYRELHDKSPEP